MAKFQKLKHSAKQIDDLLDKVESGNTSGGGVTIVTDEASLDANAQIGSMAVVVKENFSEYRKVSECATNVNFESIVNPDTGLLDVSQVVKVDGIALNPLTGVIQGVTCSMVLMTEDAMTTYDMLCFYIASDSSGNITSIMRVNITSGEQNILAAYDNGAWVIEQQQIDNCNEILKNKSYYFVSLTMDSGSALSPLELNTLDSVFRLIHTTPAVADVCVKEDVWKKPIKEVKAQIQSINNALSSKKNSQVFIESSKNYVRPQTEALYLINLTVPDNFSIYLEPVKMVEEYSLYLKGITSLNFGSESVLWANGEMPSINPDTHYELSIVAYKISDSYIYKAILTPFM